MGSLPEASLTVHALPKTLKAMSGTPSLDDPSVEGRLGERFVESELTPGRSIWVRQAEAPSFPGDVKPPWENLG
jgi:hypothetical protein